ncbi:MAG: hypothetical protein MI976_28675 [Pseudomonadales bacterium]|nr:hypothetical protein [Pseudomonadales bacterium]
MEDIRKIPGLVMLLLSTLFLSGCPLHDNKDEGDDSETNFEEEPNIEQESTANTVLQFNVVDEEGIVVEGAIASAVALNIVNQSYNENTKLAVEVTPTDESAVFRIDKTGYETGLVYIPTLVAPFSATVKLKQRLPAIPVDGLTGGEFAGVNGAQVTIAAESLQRPDGSTASGEIQLYINTVDTTDTDDLAAFPGSFDGLASGDTEPGMLASLGVTSFRFEQNGEKLQLKAGEVSQLVLPLYADTYEDGTPIPLGDLIPMWRLNEATGIWEEESTGVVVEMPTSPTGLGLQASTSHFSSFNADVWGSTGLSGGQSGPAAQSRAMPSVCRVSVQVPEFAEGTYYLAAAAQNLGALASTRTMSGIYYEPFSFPVFQGRPSALRVTEPEYNDSEGRSTVESFTCNSETLDLLIQFDAVPAFVGVEAIAKPVFEIINGQQEITSNILSLRAIFINDSDQFAQFTTNMGLDGQLASDQKVNFSYLSTDPSTVSVAFFLENELGDADTQINVDYVAEQVPTVDGAYLYKYNGATTISWSGLEGADTASLYEFDVLSSSLGILIESDIDATDDNRRYELNYDLPEGNYVIVFQNQYGITEVVVFINPSEECLPNSDLPCAA